MPSGRDRRRRESSGPARGPGPGPGRGGGGGSGGEGDDDENGAARDAEDDAAAAAAAAPGGPADLLEEIEISPWQRWARYGVWPMRMLVHGFCILSLVCYLFWTEAGLLRSSVSYERNAYNLLFRGALQHDEFSRYGGFGLDAEDFHANDFVLFNTSQTHKQIALVTRNYFRLEIDSVDRIMIAGSLASPSLPFPWLYFKLRNGTRFAHEVRSARDLGPLRGAQSREEISRFLHLVEGVRLDMWLESINPDPGLLLSEPCVRWLFTARFSRERGAGPFYGRLLSEGGHACFASDFTDHTTAQSSLAWLHAWLCVATLAHLVTALARVARGATVLRKLRAALSRGSSGDLAREYCWADVTLRDKLTILNFWNVLAILADAACLGYTIVQITDAGQRQPHQRDLVDSLGLGIGSDTNKLLLGASCALHLISLLEYAEYGLVSYLFLQVNRAARVEALMMLVGILPVTAAYVFFGVAVYGESVSRFGSVRNTAITLFSLCLGDEIWPTFRDLENVTEVPRGISVLYVLSFVVLHLNVVGMCMLAVVEQVFIEQGFWLLGAEPVQDGAAAARARPASVAAQAPPSLSSSQTSTSTTSSRASLTSAPERSLSRRNTGVSLHMSASTAAAMQRTALGRSRSRGPSRGGGHPGLQAL